ncbi:MAG: hypothetical protein ACK5PQ_04170 [Alphaproteobacteria bacterium]
MKQHLLKTSILALSLTCLSTFSAPTIVSNINADSRDVYGNVTKIRQRLDNTGQKLVVATNTISGLIGVKSGSTIIESLTDLSGKIATGTVSIQSKFSDLLDTNFVSVTDLRSKADSVYTLLQGSTTDTNLAGLATNKKSLITDEVATIKGYLTDTNNLGGTNKPATVSDLVSAVTGEGGTQENLDRSGNAGTGMETDASTLRTSLSNASGATITSQLAALKSTLGFQTGGAISSIVTRLEDLRTKSNGIPGDDVYMALNTKLAEIQFASVKALKDAVESAEQGFTEAEALTILGFNGTVPPEAETLTDATAYVLRELVGTDKTISNSSGVISKSTTNLTTIKGGLDEILTLIGEPGIIEGSGRELLTSESSIYKRIYELMQQVGATETGSLWNRVKDISTQIV